MTLPEVFSHPAAMAALVLVLFALLQYQRTLTWPEYRRLHALKVRFFPQIDRYTTLFAISRKGYREADAEFLQTWDSTPKETFRTLVRIGGSPHLLNSVKLRSTPDGTPQYSAAHVVWTHDDGTQTEAYVFDNGDGTSDLYAHHETSVTDPDGHMTDAQRDGDPRGVVPDDEPGRIQHG